MLDTCEFLRVEEALNDLGSVFDVGHVVLDSRVENIGQAVFPQEDKGQDSDALVDRVVLVLVPPDQLQIIDRVDFSLVLFDVDQQISHCKVILC